MRHLTWNVGYQTPLADPFYFKSCISRVFGESFKKRKTSSLYLWGNWLFCFFFYRDCSL